MSSVVAVRCEKLGEISLRADGFGEDHGFALAALATICSSAPGSALTSVIPLAFSPILRARAR